MEYENVMLDHIIQLAFSDGDIKKTKYYYEINIADELEPEFFEDIPYIYRYEIEGQEYLTRQAKLELSRPNFCEKRQGTRYSTHGLHEYKGKYNPQVVQDVIKYMNIKKDAYILSYMHLFIFLHFFHNIQTHIVHRLIMNIPFFPIQYRQSNDYRTYV